MTTIRNLSIFGTCVALAVEGFALNTTHPVTMSIAPVTVMMVMIPAIIYSNKEKKNLEKEYGRNYF